MEIKLTNSDGTINHLAFSEDANRWAKNIHEKGGGRQNKSSQLRKFYDEFLKLVQLSETYEEAKFRDIILPQLHMLIPKVVYANARQLVTKEFKEFIKFLVKRVQNKKDLKLSGDFFEAFIGFHKFYEESSKKSRR